VVKLTLPRRFRFGVGLLNEPRSERRLCERNHEKKKKKNLRLLSRLIRLVLTFLNLEKKKKNRFVVEFLFLVSFVSISKVA
jgi:hypothetical protein